MLRRKLENVLKPFVLSDSRVEEIRKVFESEVTLGLARAPSRKSSLQMENTYIPELCNGTEIGRYLALDLGGTNFRVILLTLTGKRDVEELVRYYTVPEELRIGHGIPLFDFLAACIHNFMKRCDLLNEKLSLGFCFSFPMIQKALNVGILVTWTKSFNCPDVVGKDAVAMLVDAIKRRGDIQVDVCAVVNDTTGTLMKGAHLDQQCAIGLILGTGCNACYLEKVSDIEKWIGSHSGIKEVVVDTEWGAFGDNGVLDFVKTKYDKAVDDESLLVHSFTFEKMFSGKFIGEVARHVIIDMAKQNILFEGKIPEKLESQYSFTAADLSEIVCDDGDMHKTKEIFVGISKNALCLRDAEIIKEVCWILSARGALLVSICLASLLDRMKKDFVTIAIDGSLYKNHPFLPDLMIAYISELAPTRKFSLMAVEDGSGKGAGLVAAVVNRLDISQLHE